MYTYYVQGIADLGLFVQKPDKTDRKGKLKKSSST